MYTYICIYMDIHIYVCVYESNKIGCGYTKIYATIVKNVGLLAEEDAFIPLYRVANL